jgi:hypothetical protein
MRGRWFASSCAIQEPCRSALAPKRADDQRDGPRLPEPLGQLRQLRFRCAGLPVTTGARSSRPHRRREAECDRIGHRSSARVDSSSDASALTSTGAPSK